MKENNGKDIMMHMILFGGNERIGFMTNPKSENQPCFIKVGNEKIVCLAKGGECRFNSNYYSPGLNDKKSWTTPIIDESCPDQCPYKVLVCDNHPEDCEDSIRYYPQYNKFLGLFERYCRNFDKIKNKKVLKIKTTTRKSPKDPMFKIIKETYYGYDEE